MMAECPMGHKENLSYQELYERLIDGDFDCRECNKKLSYEMDKQFWEHYILEEDRDGLHVTITNTEDNAQQ